jgi:hypothetical protein
MVGGYESRIGGRLFTKEKVAKAIKRQGYQIFALKQKRGKLQPGIYARYQFAKGTAIKPLLLFVKSPSYKARFDFYGVAMRTIDQHFERQAVDALQMALATAR